MRVFLLPVSTRRALIYCERLQPSKASNAKLPIQDRILNRAAQTWADWERADKGWRKYLVVQGNRLLSRIAFEEWSLKSLPPLTKARLEEIRRGDLKFECVYPSRFLSAAQASSPNAPGAARQGGGTDEDARTVLSRLALERQALHRRRMWNSLIWMPFTIPFTVVPVIPNIPFFYLCFRAYSHYRALYGGQLLAHLTSTPGSLAIRSSKELEEVYAKGLAGDSEETSREIGNISDEKIDTIAREALSRSDSSRVEPENEAVLLRPWSGRMLAEKVGVPEVQMEVERAVTQVQAAIEKAEKDTQTDDGSKKSAGG